jgi:hypothetical protein
MQLTEKRRIPISNKNDLICDNNLKPTYAKAMMFNHAKLLNSMFMLAQIMHKLDILYSCTPNTP